METPSKRTKKKTPDKGEILVDQYVGIMQQLQVHDLRLSDHWRAICEMQDESPDEETLKRRKITEYAMLGYWIVLVIFAVVLLIKTIRR